MPRSRASRRWRSSPLVPGFLLQGRGRPIDLRSGRRRPRHRGDPASARARSTRRPRKLTRAVFRPALQPPYGTAPCARHGFSDKVAMKEATTGLPGHDVVGGLTRAIEACSLAAAGALLVANVAHAFTSGLLLHWWSPLVVVTAALAADLGLRPGALDGRHLVQRDDARAGTSIPAPVPCASRQPGRLPAAGRDRLQR